MLCCYQIELVLLQSLVLASAPLVVFGPPVVVGDLLLLAVPQTPPVRVHGYVLHHLLHILEAILAASFLAVRNKNSHIHSCVNRKV